MSEQEEGDCSISLYSIKFISNNIYDYCLPIPHETLKKYFLNTRESLSPHLVKDINKNRKPGRILAKNTNY